MSAIKTKEYKSPRRKLVKFFEKSRDQWKAKCVSSKAIVKKLKNRVRYLESSKEKWKRKAIKLEKELSSTQMNIDEAPKSEPPKKKQD